VTTAWSSGTGPPAHPGGGATLTLVEGSTFCVSASTGDVLPDRAQGLFVADTRVVSTWQLRVDGAAVEPLATIEDDSYRATFVARTVPRRGLADSTLLVRRTRYVGDGMREDLLLRNVGSEAAGVLVGYAIRADFADLFAVKEGRPGHLPDVEVDVGPDTLTYRCTADGTSHSMTVTATGEPVVTPGAVTYRAVVPARGEWAVCLSVRAVTGGRPVPPRYRCDEHVDETVPARRLRSWRLASPSLSTPDTGLATTLRVSSRDLGALQIRDPDHPERRVVAAGAPWFMALFGRDSLLTSWMALPLDQQLALGTLQTLARFQGTQEDPLTEEQPGRILHEVRLGREAALALGGGRAYYGTADATPLFVALLGELHRWGLPAADVLALLPAADRALEWVRAYGDLDGDGFVEYRRATDRGLVNQGWKDSFDGVTDAAGRLAVAPIALAEVQAYVYAAYRARASIAGSFGDPATAATWEARAACLKADFNERFWLPDRGWYAMGLDRDKRPLDALASNMGHCLWCGIVDDDKAGAVAAHLAAGPLWSGFGVRTLGTTMGAYNPMSYHNGSVWPHDTAIAVAGLARYGFGEQAQRVALGLLDAAASVGGRLPELFCGFDRTEFAVPVSYPTSCAPQAWAAAAPVLVLRALLGFDPDLPAGRVGLAPAVPDRMRPLRVEHLPLGPVRVSVEVDRDGSRIEGLPAGVVAGPPP
jgi:glycogen debranching enzyme